MLCRAPPGMRLQRRAAGAAPRRAAAGRGRGRGRRSTGGCRGRAGGARLALAGAGRVG